MPPSRRIAFWCYELQQPMVEALASAGYAVSVQLQGDSGVTAAHGLMDLFLGRGLPAEGEVGQVPHALPPAVLWEYAACVVRVNLAPRFGILDTSRVGPVLADNVADWAQFHYDIARRVLRHYAVEELWLVDIPHLGVDNMFVEAALELGLPVLVLRQTALAGKFEAFEIRRDGWREVIRDGFAPIDPASLLAPVIPIQRAADRATRGPLRLSMSLLAELLSSPGGVVRRLYLGASRREWSWLRCAIEWLDPVSRPLALYRHARWTRTPAFDVRSRTRDPSESGRPYALFALHYEPEANVRAFSGDYANQVNAIEALAAWIPPDWLLLVKENPLQRGYARDTAFHQRLARLPNVRFAGPADSSADLVANAQLVGTIVGTMGFEALMAGRACIYFGMPWYRRLPGAHRFSTELVLTQVLASVVGRDALAAAIAADARRMADGVVFPRFLPGAAGQAERREIAWMTAASLVALRGGASPT